MSDALHGPKSAAPWYEIARLGDEPLNARIVPVVGFLDEKPIRIDVAWVENIDGGLTVTSASAQPYVAPTPPKPADPRALALSRANDAQRVSEALCLSGVRRMVRP